MVRNLALAVLCGTALFSLAACVSPEELRRRDEATYQSFGFTPGTTDFASCLQRESLARRYDYGFYGPPPVVGWYGPGWYPPPPYARY